LMERLREQGYTNLIFKESKELDLRRQADTEEFFKKEKPEYVFLAAAKVGGILANSTYKAEFIYDNLVIATNVIHSSYRHGVKKLLNLGSSCIYPKDAPQPIREDYLLTGSLEPTNEPYAIAKIAALKLCNYYNQQYGTNFISVMPTNLYGKNDNFNLETSHLLPSLIRKFYLARLLKEKNYDLIKKDILNIPLGFGLNNENALSDHEAIKDILSKCGISSDCVVLWGSGEPYREFLYVDDLSNACMFLMEKFNNKEIGDLINIGTGKDCRIKELAQIVKDIVGFKGEIKWDQAKPDGMFRKFLDVDKLKALGWEYKVSLEEGIKRTVEYYKKNF
ncbi:MAG: GDP-L-fucose synthase, partial [Parcubacteria group bacterium]|nr:GDP-L-fucose synthase [Parcubacteria group bacterium]